jgi:sec-independent protein translocase protein TatC
LLNSLSNESHLIATGVASSFTVPLKLCFMLSLVLTIPVLLHQIWAFIAPGLYRHERRLVAPVLCASVLLFYVGMAFAYFIVFPMIFSFFASSAPIGVVLMPDIESYLDFTFKLFLAFGLTFEVPILTLLLVWTGVTNPTKLIQKRPYIIVGAFILGMVLTPPDVLSQVLLAIPMWLLFEAGLYLAILFPMKRKTSETEVLEAS